MSLRFVRNKHGVVTSISMKQNGVNPEFLRQGLEFAPEFPPQITHQLLGSYKNPKNNIIFKVTLRKGRMAVDMWKNAFTFLPPDPDGFWKLRPNPNAMKLRFNKTDDGQIQSLTWFSGNKQIVLPRAIENKNHKLTIEKLISSVRKAYGKPTDPKLFVIRMTGRVEFPNQGVTGEATQTFVTSGGYCIELDLGETGKFSIIYNEETGFSDWYINRKGPSKGRKLRLLN